jgi:transcriptional antiterminator NusG
MKKWLVFYTKSRQEKKVNELLQRAGFEVFLPTHKVLRQWTDRKKKVEVPLFNSYIFVKEEEHNIQSILQIPGIAWIIRLNGQPAELRETEVNTIKRLIETGFSIEAIGDDTTQWKEGDKVKIADGPLKGLTGTVGRGVDADKFLVLIESINQVIRVEIPAFLLQKQ